jgi:hypothetical protein
MTERSLRIAQALFCRAAIAMARVTPATGVGLRKQRS